MQSIHVRTRNYIITQDPSFQNSQIRATYKIPHTPHTILGSPLPKSRIYLIFQINPSPLEKKEEKKKRNEEQQKNGQPKRKHEPSRRHGVIRAAAIHLRYIPSHSPPATAAATAQTVRHTHAHVRFRESSPSI